MEFFNVCTKKEWEQNGETRKKWLQCGTLRRTDDGKMFLELNDSPNTPFYVFEQKKDNEQPAEDF